jgi:hypothetical protein
VNAVATRSIAKQMGKMKLMTKNLDWVKARLEMALVSSIFLVFSNAI